MGRSRRHVLVAPLAAMLLAASAASGQERLDLTGSWRLKAATDSPGAVTFSGRQPGPEGDVYTIGVTLPDGGSRSLRGTFDGTTLRTTIAPAEEALEVGDAEGATSVGLAVAVETADRREGADDADGSAMSDSGRRRVPPREGRYVLRTRPAAEAQPRAYMFETRGGVHPDGATPVRRFGRVDEPTAIERVELTSITFTSDHGVLRDHTADWGVGGRVFPEPEWTAAAQHPISHTMDTTVTVRVELQVTPPHAAPARAVLVGDGPGDVDFRLEVELQPGRNAFEVTSTGKLERRVQRLDLAVGWSIELGGGRSAPPPAVEPATSTTPVFVTMGTPEATGNSPGFTLRRMQKAVEAVGAVGSLDPHRIVRAIIQRWGNYNLRVAYRNAWELAEDETDPTTGRLVGADCQTIVRYTRDVIQQVGVPGQADYVVIYAHCTDPAKGLESLDARNHMTRPRQHHDDHFPKKDGSVSWIAALVDGDGGLNNYEAALKFSHAGAEKYYPGGVPAVMDSPDQVIRVFTTMSWIDTGSGDLKVAEHIHAYR